MSNLQSSVRATILAGELEVIRSTFSPVAQLTSKLPDGVVVLEGQLFVLSLEPLVIFRMFSPDLGENNFATVDLPVPVVPCIPILVELMNRVRPGSSFSGTSRNRVRLLLIGWGSSRSLRTC